MEYFVYGRDRPGTMALRGELTEAHWAYMDQYDGALIARGPTFDGETVSGSLHIVDVPDAAAAAEFAFADPYYRAGVFEDVRIHRWRNTFGRTMWDFAGNDGPRFLVIGHASAERTEPPEELDVRDHVILAGPLLDDDGTRWLGTALLVETVDRDAAGTFLTTDAYCDVEVHRWQFGGRR